jgi:hypothetical protein
LRNCENQLFGGLLVSKRVIAQSLKMKRIIDKQTLTRPGTRVILAFQPCTGAVLGVDTTSFPGEPELLHMTLADLDMEPEEPPLGGLTA